jgi:hypothetical protein
MKRELMPASPISIECLPADGMIAATGKGLRHIPLAALGRLYAGFRQNGRIEWADATSACVSGGSIRQRTVRLRDLNILADHKQPSVNGA